MLLRDAADVYQVLRATRAQARHGWPLAAVLIVGAAVIVALMAQRRWPAGAAAGILAVLPWILLGGLVLRGYLTLRRRRLMLDDIRLATEAAQLGEWVRAERRLSRIVGAPLRPAAARGQVLLLLAELAEHRQRYDLSQVICQGLLAERCGTTAQLQSASIALADALLRNDQLTDAVDMLSRMRAVPLPPTLRAAAELVGLFQRILMGHHADAVAESERLRALFRRHLSTRAAYGYGLLAAAMQLSGRADDAAALWRDATMLVPAESLVQRFDLLRGVAESHVEAARPI